MATKNNPGKYDCYAKLDGDEPYFLFRAKDPVGHDFVEAWRCIRAGNIGGAIDCMWNASFALRDSGKPLLPLDSEKSQEATDCAKAMKEWALRASEPGKGF